MSSYYFSFNSGGGSISCAPCDTGLVQSLDGYTCVVCDATCQNCASNGGYRQDLDNNGNYFLTANGQPTSKCFICNSQSSSLNGNACVSCKPSVFTSQPTTSLSTATCNTNQLSGGVFILDGLTTNVDDPVIFTVVFGNDASITSWLFSNYLLSVYRTCKPSCVSNQATPCLRNVTACQSLANLCVLNMYNVVLKNFVDACTAFSSIQYPIVLSTTVTTTWGFDLPWLTYQETLSAYKSSYATYGANLNAQFLNLNLNNNKCNPTGLSFYAARYALNGSLLSADSFDMSKLELCKFLTLSDNLKVSPFSLTNYNSTCKIAVSDLLNYGANPVFYDIYLKYNNNTSLFPIPVETLNYIDPVTGAQVNLNGDDTTAKLQRRLFLVDAVSSKTSSSNVPKYVRYAKSISINFNLIAGQTSGNIYPPLIVINYDYATTADLTQSVDVNFQINYTMDLSTQTQAVWISLGILSFLAFLWTIIRIWIWSRRSGKIAVDIITLFKFVMYLSGSLAYVFCIVTIGVAFYWLVFYKGQSLAYLLVPQPSQESFFQIVLLIAFVLKFVDLMHLILVQCSYDIFFIDWERPKETEPFISSSTKQPSNISNEKESQETRLIHHDAIMYSKVSCWRTLFVANEWNELQSFRKINSTIQLIVVLFFLKVINLEALTTADCNVSLTPDANFYQGSYNGILRVGMAASLYIAIGMTQNRI